MDKRRLHHIWTLIRPVRHYYFLIAAVLFFIVGVIAFRQNNITALKLRDEVVKADQENGDVEAALRRLRTHVANHMNSDLAGGAANVQQPVQLRYRYERLVTVEKDRVSKENEKIYNQAQTECERRFPAGLSGAGRVPCIEQYVSSKNIVEQAIPDSLYKFSFIAPSWSPDLAGITLLLSAVCLLLFVTRFLIERWFRSRFAEHI